MGSSYLDKYYLCGDAPSVSVGVFRLVLSTAAEFGWEIGQMDIKAAHLQATGFSRVIYIRPRVKWRTRGTVETTGGSLRYHRIGTPMVPHVELRPYQPTRPHSLQVRPHPLLLEGRQ